MMLRDIRSKQGFTLVEIMIAVGIVILLSALSIHSLLRAKITANEAAAIQSLKTLATAMENYRAVNPTFPTTFAELCTTTPPYIDNKWLSGWPELGFRQGYRFQIKSMIPSQVANNYMLIASPVTPGYTGMRTFDLQRSIGEIRDGEGVGLGASGAPDGAAEAETAE